MSPRKRTQTAADSQTEDDELALDSKQLASLEKANAEADMDAEWREESEVARVKMLRAPMRMAERRSKIDTLLSKATAYTSFCSRNLMAVKLNSKAEDFDGDSASGSKKKRKRAGDEGLLGQPSIMTGGTLRDYQLSGFRWLVGLYENGLHGILADEMGLGKTIQTIALLAHLREKDVQGPFLICVPLSTISNWVSEIKKWVPDMPVMLYHGPKPERQQMRAELNSYLGSKERMRQFPVFVTTYEIATRDRPDLQHYGWKFIIVDEGHRLKNMNCRLIRELNRIGANDVNKVLLTGTPLQNSLAELWSLLNFLLPEVFDDIAFFEAAFDFDGIGGDGAGLEVDDAQGQIVSKLHAILAPFMLRRLKVQVEKMMPKKKEIVLYVPMEDGQREMYDMIQSGQFNALLQQGAITQGLKSRSLNNILMQLRKAALHPYLHVDPTAESQETTEDLVTASGKMLLLDQMLKSFRRNKHKVLIFSQFTSMLDIVEDYLRQLRPNFKYCRIDGTTKLDDRRSQPVALRAFTRVDLTSIEPATNRMEAFNDRSSPHFVFLLSTRAGGVGINLASANTVVILDSDWNPHQDNQAQDRAHRIGQTRDVFVYRLITARSVELKILARANSKRKLERVVIQHKRKSDAISQDELKKMLENDFTGHLFDTGEIDFETLAKVLDRDAVLSGRTKLKGKGYEIVEHKASTIVGGVNESV